MNLTEEELKLLREILAKQGQDTTGSQDPKAGEDKSHNPDKGEDAKAAAQSINPHKYERDIANRDKRIKELEAELKGKDDSAKSDSQKLEELQKAQEALVKQLETEKITSRLTGAGCRNSKAALALLDDYEGDIDKLKEGNPYLFEEASNAPSIRTGGSPQGEPKGAVTTIAEAFRTKD